MARNSAEAKTTTTNQKAEQPVSVVSVLPKLPSEARGTSPGIQQLKSAWIRHRSLHNAKYG